MAREIRYWKNRKLPEGVYVIQTPKGEMVLIRQMMAGHRLKKLVGLATSKTIDEAIAWINNRKENKRVGRLGLETEKVRWTMERVCDTFFLLHGSRRYKRDGSTNVQAVNGCRRDLSHVRRLWGHRYADQITELDVADYRADRKAAGLKESSINREHTRIITIFNKLKKWRRIGQDPVPKNLALPEDNPGESVPKASEKEFIRNVLITKEQFESLYMAADSRMRRVIIAEMNAPLRLEDLRQLCKDKVDGKANEFKGVQTKTRIDYYIPINRNLWDLIRTAPGNAILDLGGFRKRWNKAVARAGLKGLHFHDLRRTAATTLHNQGQSLKVVSTMLGHASVQTTERYLGLHAENLQAAGKILESTYGVPKGETIQNAIQMVPELVLGRSVNGIEKSKEHIER